jgi:molybdopterin-binding protein
LISNSYWSSANKLPPIGGRAQAPPGNAARHRRAAGSGPDIPPRDRRSAVSLSSRRNALPDRRCPISRRVPIEQEVTMKISARNQFKGKIIEVRKGATTAHVRLEIAPGYVVTSSITNEAVDELGLKAGGAAIAVIKASDVMIAIA